MTPRERLLRDPWLRGCLLATAVLLAFASIVTVPWPLWFAAAYVGLLSAFEVLTDR